MAWDLVCKDATSEGTVLVFVGGLESGTMGHGVP